MTIMYASSPEARSPPCLLTYFGMGGALGITANKTGSISLYSKLYPIMFSVFILNLQILPGGMLEIWYSIVVVLLTRAYLNGPPAQSSIQRR